MFYTDLIKESVVLKRSGWNKKKIDFFIGKPDKVINKVNKKGVVSAQKMWSVQRIQFIESTKEFLIEC